MASYTQKENRAVRAGEVGWGRGKIRKGCGGGKGGLGLIASIFVIKMFSSNKYMYGVACLTQATPELSQTFS